MLGAVLLFGQDWTTATTLPKVDLSGLTPAQTTRALKLLREQDCSCRCGMKVAECRMKDPGCAYSRGMAAETVAALRKGKTDQQVLAAVAASEIAKGPADHSKLLEDAVNIPVTAAPDRKSTRLNSSHMSISYAVFCL